MGFILNKRGIIEGTTDDNLNGYEKADVKRKRKAGKDIEQAEAAEFERRQAASKSDKPFIKSNSSDTGKNVDKLKGDRYKAAGANAPEESKRLATDEATTSAAGSGVQVSRVLSKKAINKSKRMNQAGPSASKVRPWK